MADPEIFFTGFKKMSKGSAWVLNPGFVGSISLIWGMSEMV